MVAAFLTGGIGAGKSTVAALLAGRGAVVVDADALARSALAPGTEEAEAVVARFGHAVVAADGSIDRARLAAVVFSDAAARAELEALVHPVVRRGLASAVVASAGRVVVLEVPLVAEARTQVPGVDRVVVVDTRPEIALRRLVSLRGMDEREALRRMAAQASREERLALASFVVRNEGSMQMLEGEVERLWGWLRSGADVAGRPAGPAGPAGHERDGVVAGQ